MAEILATRSNFDPSTRNLECNHQSEAASNVLYIVDACCGRSMGFSSIPPSCSVHPGSGVINANMHRFEVRKQDVPVSGWSIHMISPNGRAEQLVGVFTARHYAEDLIALQSGIWLSHTKSELVE